MSKKDHHHGENIKKMEQVPERFSTPNPPELLKSSRGNIPPTELKRITHKTAKRQEKKPSNQVQK